MGGGLSCHAKDQRYPSFKKRHTYSSVARKRAIFSLCLQTSYFVSSCIPSRWKMVVVRNTQYLTNQIQRSSIHKIHKYIIALNYIWRASDTHTTASSRS